MLFSSRFGVFQMSNSLFNGLLIIENDNTLTGYIPDISNLINLNLLNLCGTNTFTCPIEEFSSVSTNDYDTCECGKSYILPVLKKVQT